MMKKSDANTLAHSLFVLAITCLTLGQSCIPQPESVITDLDAGWQNLYLGSETDVPFFPDGNAVYLDYRFEPSLDAPYGIRLSGAFPQARYLGVSVYDNSNLAVIDRIADTDIVPDDGSINPFFESVASTGNDTYTVDIVPVGYESPGTHNVLSYNANVYDVSLFLRYYLPEDGVSGGSPFPKLSAFDLETGEPLPLPEFTPNDFTAGDNPVTSAIRTTLRDAIVQNEINALFNVVDRQVLRAYRYASEVIYANGDTAYLGMMIRKDRDEVAIIRFKPPTHASTPDKLNSSDVRYWSISQGDVKSYNLVTQADEEFNVNDDGFIYLAIAEPGQDMTNAVGSSDNFMPWRANERGVILFRHLVTNPDYEFGFSKVPAVDIDVAPISQAAVNFIGEYAPFGIIVTRVQFVRDGFKPIRAQQ